MLLILHFGGQYPPLIGRAVREHRVEACLCQPPAIPLTPPVGLAGVILSGSPASVNAEALDYVRRILEWNVPVLGICFGHQLLATLAGGTVTQQKAHEYGRAMFKATRPCRLTQNMSPRDYSVWMSHGDSVTAPPTEPGWIVAGTTNHGPYALIAHEQRRLYGVQFHPEVTQTTCGHFIFENFIRDICQATRDFSATNLVDTTIASIQQQVGPTGHIVVACSLGVDSTTVAAACCQALGQERVHPIFINNGLMRHEDLELARTAYRLFPEMIVVDDSETFLQALEGVEDPQEKRRRIGQLFWHAFHRAADRLSLSYPIVAFSQGTIAPDVIESGAESTAAAVIKTHHNLVPTHVDFPFPPFEPLRTLYKDQVRILGELVNVPPDILRRHPFPGPGLAIRVSGPLTRQRIQIVRDCDALFINHLKQRKLYDSISQAFAVLGEGQAVCVRGDSRARGWPLQLRAFYTRDFMTAEVAALDHSSLNEVSTIITNRVPEVACVSYNHTSKPPGTIEWE